ncbi:hypothetical protein OG21DRAFT_1524748 [Imleria badia]|nr:hypothetical protein OG21DRAFT_1524748 [Imleria badia]
MNVTAASCNKFGSAVHGLVDRATRFCGKTAPSDLHSQVERVCRERDNLKQELSSAHNKIARLSQGINIPIPTTVHNKGHQLEQTQLALLGMPMEINQLGAGPSCVPPMSLFSPGRVHAEPAASVPPTMYPLSSHLQSLPAYSTSSCKGKEHQISPAPICSVLPYEDIHNTKPVTGPSALETIQGTLFHEFTGEEYPKNMLILGEGFEKIVYHKGSVHLIPANQTVQAESQWH